MNSLFAGGARTESYSARNRAIKQAVEEGHGHLVLEWLTSGGAALLRLTCLQKGSGSQSRLVKLSLRGLWRTLRARPGSQFSPRWTYRLRTCYSSSTPSSSRNVPRPRIRRPRRVPRGQEAARGAAREMVYSEYLTWRGCMAGENAEIDRLRTI